MTLPQANELFVYWQESPPEHEALAMLLRIYTTWEPKGKPMTDEERTAAHRASLEARWASGAAMNAKQMLEATGGVISFDGSGGPPQMGGIGPFPGAH